MPKTKTEAMPLPSTASVLTAALAQSKKTKSEFAHSAGMNSSDLGRYLDGRHAMAFDRVKEVLERNGLVLRVDVQPAPLLKG